MIRKWVAIVLFIALSLVPSVVSAEGGHDKVGYGFTPERLKAFGSAMVGLISVVIGGLSFARSIGRFGTGNGRRGAIVAAAVGLVCIVLSGLTASGQHQWWFWNW